MTEIEIRRLNVGSILKVSLYISILPAVVIFLFGIIMLLAGIFLDFPQLVIIGIIYLFMPVFIASVYAVMGILASLIYNLLAQKFGGIKLSWAKSGQA